LRLVVTGGSSFVGAHFCAVASRHHEVHALFHSCPVALNHVTSHRVDLRRSRDVQRVQSLAPDAIIHLACRIKAPAMDGLRPSEAAARVNRGMMDAVLSFGVPVVYASSTVVHWSTPTPYGASRLEDEQRLAESGLPHAILRPSAPYGPRLLHHRPRHQESFHTLARLVRHAPFVPVIGSGQQRRQPIHVHDFAEAILRLLRRPLPNRAFEAGGGSAHTMRELIALMGRPVGRSPIVLPLPKPLFVGAARLLPDFDPDLMAAADEDELADPSELAEFTGHQPRTFPEAVDELMARC
jgi:nucleoside-diphosphate-sugar epimerase